MAFRDPVCGMSVDPAKAAGRSEFGGQTYYFCALSCKKRFDQAPESFLHGAKAPAVPGSSGRSLRDFTPLIVIFAAVFALTGLAVWRHGRFESMHAMRCFEGFFFLIFAAFKLLNWKGFADAYGTYDLIAQRVPAYGYAYPLIELALGISYLLNYRVLLVSWVTLVLMVIGAAGVALALGQKRQIPCACLGVVFKIPMTWVTLVEDLVMATMAAVMIAMI